MSQQLLNLFFPWDLDSPSHVILWALRLAKNLESTEGFVGAVPRWSDSRSWYYHHRWKTTIIINNPHHHPTKSATKYPGYMLPVSQYHMEFNWKISNIFQLPFLDPLDDPCQKTAASSAYAWGIFRILWCAQGKSDTVASETTKKMDLELLRNSPFFVFEGSCFFPQNAFSEKLHFFFVNIEIAFFLHWVQNIQKHSLLPWIFPSHLLWWMIFFWGKSCNQQVFMMIRPSSGVCSAFCIRTSLPHEHFCFKRYVPETHTSSVKGVRRMSFLFHVWDIVFVWSATLLFKMEIINSQSPKVRCFWQIWELAARLSWAA